jgi:hypothetical protein
MNLPFLIQMLQNKITMLNTARGQAVSTGDMNQVNLIDQELFDTQNTFNQLALLTDVTKAAAEANVSVTDLVSSGTAAIQQVPLQGPSAGAVVNGYDISAYATDPLYESKIQSILASMPILSTTTDADTYIQSVAPGSPITGAMIRAATTLYPVDNQLLLAIMQNDSSFGTLGVGARTNNPGNVGNTGTAEQPFASWGDGVTAVAQWLSQHQAGADPSAFFPLIDSTIDTSAAG